MLKSLVTLVNWVEVVSSQLSSVAYDPESKILFIKFQNQTVYSYSEVPVEIYEQLIAAESVGKFFNANIKTSFKYEKVV